MLWVFNLRAGAKPDVFESGIERVAGDAVYRIHVVRSYGKRDRKEAPVGIDEAESGAV